jgi:hypothetical protein
MNSPDRTLISLIIEAGEASRLSFRRRAERYRAIERDVRAQVLGEVRAGLVSERIVKVAQKEAPSSSHIELERALGAAFDALTEEQ